MWYQQQNLSLKKRKETDKNVNRGCRWYGTMRGLELLPFILSTLLYFSNIFNDNTVYFPLNVSSSVFKKNKKVNCLRAIVRYHQLQIPYCFQRRKACILKLMKHKYLHS